jgi:hypothetical protein
VGIGSIIPFILNLRPRWRLWSSSYPSHLTAGTHWTGDWLSPRANLDGSERKKIFSTCQEANSVIHTKVYLCINWGIAHTSIKTVHILSNEGPMNMVRNCEIHKREGIRSDVEPIRVYTECVLFLTPKLDGCYGITECKIWRMYKVKWQWHDNHTELKQQSVSWLKVHLTWRYRHTITWHVRYQDWNYEWVRSS